MKIQESGENYLETIYMLQQKNGSVRSIDIANELEFAKPSVSRAMGILKEAGLIIVEHSGNIVLTEAGYKRATEIYERHSILTEFMVNSLGVSEETAEKDACRIEHVISQETFEKIKSFINK